MNESNMFIKVLEEKTEEGVWELIRTKTNSLEEKTIPVTLECGEIKTIYVTPLECAILYNKIKIVKFLLKSGANVNNQDDRKRTALFYAISISSNQNLNIINLLIESDADVNKRDIFGQTPLHLAVEKNNIETVELLLKHGAHVNSWCDKYSTPLGYAIHTNHNIEITQKLLEFGANPNAQYIPYVQIKPLHLAVIAKSPEMIELLLKHGADVNCNSFEGSPLFIAVEMRCLKIIKLLVDNGANVNDETKFDTPLFHLIKTVHEEIHVNEDKEWEKVEKIICYLLNHGADINSLDSCDDTPLIFAVSSCNVQLTSILLKLGADVKILQEKLFYPLEEAIDQNNEKLIELLFKYIQCSGTEFMETLCYHVVRENFNMVNVLMKYCLDVNGLTEFGRTPLLEAISSSNIEMVKCLIKFGCDVNMKNFAFIDENPLMYAILKKNSEIVRLLLEHGADVNIICDFYSPLQLVIYRDYDNIDIFNLILKQSPNLDAISNSGTALHVAVERNRDDILKILLDLGADINILRPIGDIKSVLLYALSINNGIIINILLMHIMKLRTTNKYISPDILETFNEELAARGTTYKEEYKKLKSKIINKNNSVTLYDVCTENLRTMSKHLSNSEIRNSLETEFYTNYLASFPNYTIVLNCRIRDAIVEAEQFAKRHSQLRSILNETFIFPVEITRYITSFIRNEDFKFID